MGNLFPGYNIDLENGYIYNIDGTKKGSFDGRYYTCYMKDCYGNEYYNVHQVIISEGLGLPKHLWPVDEKGRRYEVDHIIPVKNGGTNALSNLRLVSIKDNHNNEATLINYSNAVSGEKNNFYGKHHTDEWKKAVSLKMSGKNHPLYNKHHTDESRKKMSDAKKGKYKGENNPMYGKKRLDNIKRFSKPVLQCNMNGDVIKEWDSASSTSSEGFSPSNVSQCCRGEKNTHKGYKWKFK